MPRMLVKCSTTELHPPVVWFVSWFVCVCVYTHVVVSMQWSEDYFWETVLSLYHEILVQMQGIRLAQQGTLTR